MVNVDITPMIVENYQAFKAILELMDKSFTNPIVEPTQKLETIMYNAGQYSVLLYFKAKMKEAEEILQDNVINEV